MLDPTFCRERQKRLVTVLQERKLDAVVIGAPHHVYYFTAHYTHPLQQSALLLMADGRSRLYTANEPNTTAAADDVISYIANRTSTLRQDQEQAVAEDLLRSLPAGSVKQLGLDSSAISSQIALRFAGAQSTIDDALWQMRRVKDADELVLMRKAIACSQAMYAQARQIIAPGISELEVYGQLHMAAVLEAGEPLRPAYLGNDYACGVPGGPARGGRTAQAGELYILDLGPAYRGYFSDSARTFSVDGKPTDAQHAAWERVTHCLSMVKEMARPGVCCREIFAAVSDYLLSARGSGMGHHLGHGVGLQPHEYPHLNPEWDDTLMEGEIFTAEPGEYGEALRGGIRIENMYRVSKGGVENLVDVPLGLDAAT